MTPVKIVGLIAGSALVLAGCSSSGGGSPTTPTPTDHAPVVTSVTASPSFGVSQLTSFSFNASATDADNDSLTYSWTFGDGASAAGQTATHVYTNSGAEAIQVTANDGKGMTGTGTQTVNVGSMTGTWSLTTIACPGQTATLALTQTGGTVTGTISMPNGFCNAAPGLVGNTDPAQPGTIDAAGNVFIRFKGGDFIDFHFQGVMQSPGRTVTGGVFDSGFSGEATTLTKVS